MGNLPIGKSKFEYPFILRPNNLFGRYGCSIAFQNGKINNEIRYKLDIQFLKDQKQINIFKLNRTQELFINDRPPVNFIDRLAFETSSVLYPLVVEFSDDGSIRSIKNFDEIKERWIKAKKKIQKYYKGELTDDYLKRVDASLKSKGMLSNKLSKDWFLYMYFKLFYKNNFTEKYMQFPTSGKALPINYEVNHNIQERIEAKDILIKIDGIINDDRCALDLEQELDYPYFKNIDENEKNMKGICDITYSLNEKTKVIEGIDAQFYTEYQKPKRIELKMFLLRTLSK